MGTLVEPKTIDRQVTPWQDFCSVLMMFIGVAGLLYNALEYSWSWACNDHAKKILAGSVGEQGVPFPADTMSVVFF
jgi:hypothetical protein